MTRKDIVQIGAWAAATAVVAVNLAIGHTAVGDNEGKGPKGPVTVVYGLRITVTATPSAADRQRIAIDVGVENPTDTAVALAGKVTVVRQEYYGNPLSRAFVPTDFKRVTIPSAGLYGVYPPGKTKTIRLVDVQPPAPTTPSLGKAETRGVAAAGAPASKTAPAARRAPTITYGIAVLDGSGRSLPVAGVRPVVAK